MKVLSTTAERLLILTQVRHMHWKNKEKIPLIQKYSRPLRHEVKIRSISRANWGMDKFRRKKKQKKAEKLQNETSLKKNTESIPMVNMGPLKLPSLGRPLSKCSIHFIETDTRYSPAPLELGTRHCNFKFVGRSNKQNLINSHSAGSVTGLLTCYNRSF